METISVSPRRQLELHRRALALATAEVAAVEGGSLTLPTPCVGWDLRALLAHMIGQNHGFADAVRSGDAPAEAFAPRDVDRSSLTRAWRQSVQALTSAVDVAPLDRPVRLAVVPREPDFPLPVVIGFHLLDTVVHAWDVATSLGRPFRPDDDLVAVTLATARRVPAGTAREQPGAAFAPPVAPATDAGPDDGWATALALLGRQQQRHDRSAGAQS